MIEFIGKSMGMVATYGVASFITLCAVLNTHNILAIIWLLFLAVALIAEGVSYAKKKL